jgi:putative ABC transport system permease protein
MTVLGLAWRGLWHRRLSTILTAVSVALGVALIVLVVRAREGARTSFQQVARGYDIILGPTHGSSLQITLNTLFHIGDASGTVPWEEYQAIRKDERVAFAVPYAVGDNFRGHHVVGTTRDIFSVLRDAGDVPLGRNVRGRLFDKGTFEAVIGSAVSSKHGLRRGSSFSVSHGADIGGQEHGERWTVVGVMRPTGTPADRALFIPIETFYEIGDHQKEADNLRKQRKEKAEEAGEDPDDGHAHGGHGHSHGEGDSDEHVHGLSAVGVRLYAPFQRFAIRSEYMKERRGAQVSIPVEQVGDLLQIVERVDGVFQLVAWLVVLVAALSILVGLYNTIQGRRREIAILRALGARPGHVFAVIVLEAVMICFLGGLLGVLLGQLALVTAGPILVENYGVNLSPSLGALELEIAGALAVVGLLAGLLPAWNGLRTQVAANLHPQD